MSVLIRGMEMPTSCMLCPFCVEEADPANGEMCMVTGKLMPPCTRVRLDSCPLIPVPPHGRLIDADAFEKANAYFWGRDFINPKYEDCLCDLVNAAPTIIPAEEGET